MSILRIEHPVLDYDAWKEAFDRDPVGREQAGVRRYRIFRAMDDPNFVMIDLEFDTPTEAGSLLAAMQRVWQGVSDTIITDPRARIVQTAESVEY